MVLRIYAPVQNGDDWDCRYEIAWPPDAGEAVTRSHAVGSDAIHALQLAMQKLGVDLHMTKYHRDGALRWMDGWEGYGLAVPKDARGLLKGDDARYFG